MKPIPRIVILGPQGAGKGTQAVFLSRLLRIPHISAGEELRQEMRTGTPLGKKITATMNAGILISDQDTNRVMRNRLYQRRCQRGWISDGYPRRMGQLRPMMRFARPNLIILMDIPDSQAIKRLAGRRVCPNGHVYHLQYNKPKRRGYCDIDGLKLVLRDDDSPAAIRKRLTIYHNETEPMLHWIKSKVNIIKIDATKNITTINRELKSKLISKPWLSSPRRKK